MPAPAAVITQLLFASRVPGFTRFLRLSGSMQIEPVETAGIAAEDPRRMAWGQAFEEAPRQVEPLRVAADQVQHRPVAPPDDPLGSEAGKHVCHEGRQLCGRAPLAG